MTNAEQLPLSSQPYLEDSATDGRPRLLAGECEDCSQRVFPPPAVCPFCMGERLRSVPISRRGTLYSYSCLAQGAPEFDSPYVIAYVDMPEGVRVFTQIAAADPKSLVCGMTVELMPARPKTDRYGRAVGQFQFAPVAESTSR
jgi:uncharacterized OB-fold protein